MTTLYSNRYDIGFAIIGGTHTRYNTKHIKGPAGVLAEMLIRASIAPRCPYMHKAFVCRTSFRRTCKRHDSSQKEARQLLRDKGLIVDIASFTYGASLNNVKVDYHSLAVWNMRGYKVLDGEQSYVRCVGTGTPLFNNFQVEEKRRGS